MASTLKFENVAPPISGSVVSAPSMAKTVVVPRWPLTANCCVKFAAPLASVMVPAANKSSLLKSRELSGRLDTSFRERCPPPLASETAPFCSCTRTRVVSDCGSCKFVVSSNVFGNDKGLSRFVRDRLRYYGNVILRGRNGGKRELSANLRLRRISRLSGNVSKDNGGSDDRRPRIVTKNAGPGGSRSRGERPNCTNKDISANMSAPTRKRCEAGLLTPDATDFFEGVIFISSVSVYFEIGSRRASGRWGREGRHRFRSCRDAPRDVHARKALSYEARIPLLSREQ